LPTSSKTSQKDIDQDTVISDLKTTVSSLKETRVSTETFNGLKDRVTALENKSTPVTTTYTKTEVDAAISQAITNAVNNLKNDQSWVKGISSGYSSSGGSTSSNVLSTDEDLELVLERAPGDEEVWINDKIPVEWRLTVINKAASGVYFRIRADFVSTESSVAIVDAHITPSYSQSSMQFTPNPLTTAGTVNTMTFSSQASSSDTRVWIPKNSQQTLYLVLYVDYTDTTVTGKRWEWEFDVNQMH
jgi:hypothetical protein